MKSLKILHLSDIHIGGNETLLKDLIMYSIPIILRQKMMY